MKRMKKKEHTPQQGATRRVRPASYSRTRKGSGVQRAVMGQQPLLGTSADNARNAAPTASTYSRETYAREFSKPKKHRKGLIALVIAMAAALILGGVAFGGFMYMQSISDKLQENVDEELVASLSQEEVAPEDPFYVLLMGVDRSDVREKSSDTFRSDSMMLARIDPHQKIVTLVSIERDTYVNIDDVGAAKINASAAYGGAPLVIDTIEEFAGVPISHYVEIDFDGFKAAVDALGGIEVDVPITIDDDNAGGHVDAGLQTLNGDQALILCRSRHAYDEYGSGDYYRMANQRMVIGAIAKEILHSDPVTMANTVNAMAEYITTDMSMSQIVSIATQMKGMDVENDIYSAHNPTISSYDGVAWIEYCDLEAWKEMMTRVDQGLPPYEDEERNKNDGGGLDGTVTGEQEYVPEGSGAAADGWTSEGKKAGDESAEESAPSAQ